MDTYLNLIFSTSLKESLIGAIFVCFLFFVSVSPLGLFFRTPFENWLKSLIIKTKGNKIVKWCVVKFLYLINCVFCVCFWFYFLLGFLDSKYFVLATICPWISLIMWQTHLFLKNTKKPLDNKK